MAFLMRVLNREGGRLEIYRAPTLEIVCYTAGFFDGEGSIWLQTAGNRYYAGVSQSTSNDGERLMRWLQSEWAVGTVNAQRKRHRGDEWIQWHWSVNAAREVRFFLGALLPYLHVKRTAAERALLIVPTDRRTRWSPSEDRFIREQWAIASERDIAMRIERTETGLRHRARKLGLPDKRIDGRRVQR